MKYTEMAKMTDAALNGEEYRPQGEAVVDYPQAFKDFIRDNADTIEERWSEGKINPYFIEHNKDVVNDILNPQSGDGGNKVPPTGDNTTTSFEDDGESEEEKRKRIEDAKKRIEEAETLTTQEIAERRKSIKKEAIALFDKIEIENENFKDKIVVTKKSIKEWLNQPHAHYAVKNEMLLMIDEVIRQSKYIGGINDKHDPLVKAHLFEVEINGQKSWILVRELQDGRFLLYSILDNYPKQKPRQ